MQMETTLADMLNVGICVAGSCMAFAIYKCRVSVDRLADALKEDAIGRDIDSMLDEEGMDDALRFLAIRDFMEKIEHPDLFRLIPGIHELVATLRLGPLSLDMGNQATEDLCDDAADAIEFLLMMHARKVDTESCIWGVVRREEDGRFKFNLPDGGPNARTAGIDNPQELFLVAESLVAEEARSRNEKYGVWPKNGDFLTESEVRYRAKALTHPDEIFAFIPIEIPTEERTIP